MEKNNKGLMILVAILSVIILGLVGYITYDKVINVEECNDKVADNEKNNVGENNNEIILEGIEKFKNYDGTYGSIVNENVEICDTDGKDVTCKEYYIFSGIDGKITIKNSDRSKTYQLDISNVIDIKCYNGGLYDGKDELFILTSNGDVYNYKLSNLIKEKFDLVKLDLTNVNSVKEVSYSAHEQAGGCTNIIAITNDNKYIKLLGSCM